MRYIANLSNTKEQNQNIYTSMVFVCNEAYQSVQYKGAKSKYLHFHGIRLQWSIPICPIQRSKIKIFTLPWYSSAMKHTNLSNTKEQNQNIYTSMVFVCNKAYQSVQYKGAKSKYLHFHGIRLQWSIPICPIQRSKIKIFTLPWYSSAMKHTNLSNTKEQNQNIYTSMVFVCNEAYQSVQYKGAKSKYLHFHGIRLQWSLPICPIQRSKIKIFTLPWYSSAMKHTNLSNTKEQNQNIYTSMIFVCNGAYQSVQYKGAKSKYLHFHGIRLQWSIPICPIQRNKIKIFTLPWYSSAMKHTNLSNTKEQNQNIYTSMVFVCNEAYQSVQYKGAKSKYLHFHGIRLQWSIPICPIQRSKIKIFTLPWYSSAMKHTNLSNTKEQNQNIYTSMVFVCNEAYQSVQYKGAKSKYLHFHGIRLQWSIPICPIQRSKIKIFTLPWYSSAMKHTNLSNTKEQNQNIYTSMVFVCNEAYQSVQYKGAKSKYLHFHGIRLQWSIPICPIQRSKIKIFTLPWYSSAMKHTNLSNTKEQNQNIYTSMVFVCNEA